ncbi:MAG: hypothetical protein ACK526_19285 [Planctomyces sp.]
MTDHSHVPGFRHHRPAMNGPQSAEQKFANITMKTVAMLLILQKYRTTA